MAAVFGEVYVTVAVCILAQVAGSSGSGLSTYIAPTNFHCFPCPPGYRVKAHCHEELTNSTCIKCTAHYYSDRYNTREHCDSCKTQCPQHSSETHDCTSTSNRQCVCDEGRHRYPIDPLDNFWECKPHSACEEGAGVLHKGNHTHDTHCEECGDHQFVNSSDPNHPVCQDCSRCPTDFILITPCSSNSDTQCAPKGNASEYIASSTPAMSSTVSSEATTMSADKQSQSLDGWTIFGIVYGTGFAVGGVACLILFLIVWKCDLKKRTMRELWLRYKKVIIVCVFLGIDLLVIMAIFIFVQCRRRRQRENQRQVTYCPVEGQPFQTETEAVAGSQSNHPGEAGERAPVAGGDAVTGNGVDDSQVRENGPGPGTGGSDNSLHLENEGRSGSGDAMPQEVNLDFIERDVFGYLCKNLGTEWEFFIRRLPVLPPVQSSEMKALVDHAKMERPDTQNRIDACLIGWKKKCVECVTIGNIVESLQYVGRNDLAEKVEKRDLII